MAISKGEALMTNPKHWRDRAAEARLLAKDMKDPESKAAMLRIANDYDRIAERAQERAKLTPS
jgi:uncharacterized protein with PhoU and TrkA domain